MTLSNDSKIGASLVANLLSPSFKYNHISHVTLHVDTSTQSD
jgi:hypothetical protein